MSHTDPNLPLWLAFLSMNEQATRDWLTGLYNRRYFEETLIDHIAVANRYHRELSLVLFDIDQFKQINDALGHEAGDKILQQFSNLLQSTARKADIVCRHGGDEFAVILPETGAANAWKFAERVFKRLESSKEWNFTATAGMAALPSDHLVAEADADLLERKREACSTSRESRQPQNQSQEPRDEPSI